MDKKENLVEFKSEANKTIGLLNLTWPALIEFTRDNAFPNFLQELCDKTFRNIEEAINENDLTEYKKMEEMINRYMFSASDSLSLRITPKEVMELLQRINILILNWIRMVEELKKEKVFSLSADFSSRVKSIITDIDNVISMSSTVKYQIDMAERLIRKAEDVLSAAPRAFNLSKHFIDAIKSEME